MISPWEAVEASNTLGLENWKVAVPEDPSLARVSLMVGITFSLRPLQNWISASRAVEEYEGEDVKGDWGEKANAVAGRRTRMDFRRVMVMLYYNIILNITIILLGNCFVEE